MSEGNGGRGGQKRRRPPVPNNKRLSASRKGEEQKGHTAPRFVESSKLVPSQYIRSIYNPATIQHTIIISLVCVFSKFSLLMSLKPFAMQALN